MIDVDTLNYSNARNSHRQLHVGISNSGSHYSWMDCDLFLDHFLPYCRSDRFNEEKDFQALGLFAQSVDVQPILWSGLGH